MKKGLRQLGGKIAVITGAANGIGRALALGLWDKGCSSALLDLSASGLTDLQDSLVPTREGQRVSTHVVDVGDKVAMEAAAREGRRLDVGEIAGFCRYAGPAEGDAVVITEGVGGVMAPLSEEETVADWMTALSWPVVLVAGSYLGTLSHTLTAVEAVKYRGLKLSGVVISQSADSSAPYLETIETVARLVAETPVIGLPRHDTARETIENLPNIAEALGLIGARSEA